VLAKWLTLSSLSCRGAVIKLALRDNFTVYDAAYVVLAQQLQSPLVTRDAKLADARRIGVVVELF
jgi:predicted nucleic acid-binding protein